MTDVFTKAKRSDVMSRIRGKGNQATEIRLMKILRKHKITGWRRHSKRVTGCPDFSWSKERVAVFVDGCFWHGCAKHYQLPRNNRAFWRKKIEGNKKLDKRVTRILRSRGWRVIRIWEHSLEKRPESVIILIQDNLSDLRFRALVDT